MYTKRTTEELLAISRHLVEEGDRLCRQLTETAARVKSYFAEGEKRKWPLVERRRKPRTAIIERKRVI